MPNTWKPTSKSTLPTTPQFEILRSDLEGERIELRVGDRVTVGSQGDIRIDGVPTVVGQFTVDWYERQRAFDSRRPRARLLYTPYWSATGRDPEPDSGPPAILDAESTIEVGSTTLTVRDIPPDPDELTRFQRIERAFEQLSPVSRVDRRSRLQPGEAHLLGRYRTQQMVYFGVTVSPAEARIADWLSSWGRIGSIASLLTTFALCAVAVGLAAFDPAWRLPIAIALPVAGLVIMAVSTTFYFASTGPWVLAATSVLSVAIATAPFPQLLLLNIIACPVIVVLAWQIAAALDRHWLPIPSEHRGDATEILVFPVAALIPLWTATRAGTPITSMEWTMAIAIGLLPMVWTYVVVPRVQKEVLSPRPSPWLWSRRPKKATPISKDALALAEHHWLRLRRRVLIQGMAVLLAVLPLFAVLNRMDLDGRIALPSVADSTSTFLVWSGRGESISDELLQSVGWIVATDGELSAMGLLSLSLLGLAVWADPDVPPELADAFVPETVEDLQNALERDGASVWNPVKLGDEPTVAGLSRVFVWKTTAPELQRATRIYFALAPLMIALIFLAVLILWRAQEHGLVAWLAAAWALGSGGMLFLLPVPGVPTFSWVGLHGIQEALLATFWHGPIGLVAYSMFLVLLLVGLVASIATLAGLITTLLVVQWTMPVHRWLDDGLLRRIGVRGAALGILAVLFWLNVALDWRVFEFFHPHPDSLGDWIGGVAVLLPLLASWALYKIGTRVFGLAKRVSHPQQGAGPVHLYLLFTPWSVLSLVFVVTEGNPDRVWLMWAISGLGIASIVWIVVGRNTWRMAGSRAGASLAAGVMLPFVFVFLEQRLGDALVARDLVPPGATGIAVLILFGLLLRPFAAWLTWTKEWLILGPTLHRLMPRIPRMIEHLLQVEDADHRTRQLRILLEDPEIGLRRYVLYSRKGVSDGPFRPVLHGYEPEEFEPPQLDVSDELLKVLARSDGFIDATVALHEPETSMAAPELWRLMRSLDVGTTSVHGDQQAPESERPPRRSRFILPLAVGSSVFAMLIVGDRDLDEKRRREPFARRIGDLVLASM